VTGLLSPARRRGVEILDDPAVDPELMKRSMRDVERANELFGGRRAVMAELMPALRTIRGRGRMLDVGTGRGDIPAAVRRAAAAYGVELWTVGMDVSAPLVSAHRSSNDAVVRADALELPFRDNSVDVVMASQVLHHFEVEAAVAVVREMNRVARSRVVISDLRRSVLAVVGLWLGSFALRFHPVSRHDGVVSVMRGFLPSELSDIVESAIGHRPVVRRRLGFRLTTSWVPQKTQT
jgi:SAM-dependent methyltransferase